MKNRISTAFDPCRWIAAGLVCYVGPVSGQQSDGSRPPIIVHERSQASTPEPLADDVASLRRQARALQRDLADREKDIGKLQRSLEAVRQELMEVEKESLQFKSHLKQALAKEKEALAASRRHEQALEQAMAEAEKTRQAMELLEEELKTHRAFADEAARETEALKELLSHHSAAPVSPIGEASGTMSGSLAEAHRLLSEGQIDQAAGLFRQGVARWPDNPAYPIGLASCHYAAGKLAVAKALLQKILDEDSQQAEAQGLLGLILWQEDDLRQAERRLERAVKAQPDNERWQVYLGMIHYARGHEGDARKAFEEAIRINPLNPEAQFNLAILLAGGKNPDPIKARVHYEQALRLGSPPDPELEKLVSR